MKPKHTTVLSFKHAFEGITSAYGNEPHLRIHFGFALLAIVMGILLKITTIEWVVVSSAIFFVISLELLNTVIESLVNLVSPEIRPEAKLAKDVSASVVLCAAIYSLVVGGLVFLPKVISLFA